MSARRWPRAFAALLLAALLATLGGGCGGASPQHRAADARALAQARTMRLGAQVFAQRCATCHPLLGHPNTDYHDDTPPLDLDQVRPTRAYVMQRLQTGGVGMGGFGDTSEPRLQAVAAYVLAVGGREVAVPSHVPAAVLATGRALYAQHCQSCHRIEGRRPTHPNPIWEGTDFEGVRPSVAYVEQKVQEGQREAMPSFRGRLTRQQVRAVAFYVNRAAR